LDDGYSDEAQQVGWLTMTSVDAFEDDNSRDPSADELGGRVTNAGGGRDAYLLLPFVPRA
jgi:hypothetical protein